MFYFGRWFLVYFGLGFGRISEYMYFSDGKVSFSWDIGNACVLGTF